MKNENEFSVETDRSSRTILLVDDSSVNLGVVVENLESYGYDVLVAEDGEEALQRVEVAAPDLILLDVMMPGMDGFEVCRRLKAQVRTRDIPVIFMTSLSATEDKVKGFAAGGVDYITKPVQVDEVRARIGTHLELRALQNKLEEKNVKLQREVGERKRIEEALIAREGESRRQVQFQQSLLSGLRDADIILVTVENGNLVYTNDHYLGCHLGYIEGVLSEGIGFTELIHPDDRPGIVEMYRDRLAGKPVPPSYEIGVLRGDGSRREFELFVMDVPDSNPPKMMVLARDIAERKRTEMELQRREREFRSLAENLPDTIARFNCDCQHIYVNLPFSAMVDGGEAALLGKRPSECPGGLNAELYEANIRNVFTTGEPAEFEYLWRDNDGREICSLVRLAAERDATGSVTGVLAVGRDITELNEHRNRIYQMAFYDSLTSLPNRSLFVDRLRQTFTDASRHGQMMGMMLLDLDRFKAVNDTLGHPVGDVLLREVAVRLAYCVRGYDTVARLGGDEFAILLPEIRSGDDLGRVAKKIIESFNAPFILEGKEVFVTCSIGISVYPSDSGDANNLLKQADSAMYLAKRSGRNTFRFYSKDLTSSANERLTLEADLRRGFARGELELYYQPKINLADGVMRGSEALLRWNHPQRGMVPPDMFISIAEDSGMIVKIGEWVLRNGCQTACEWNRPGKPLHKVAINLSARQFVSNNLVKTVRKVLKETGCQPEWIELEITESLLLDEDGEVLEMLKGFREMGITIAIDDFGTGYSALSYLARFPIDTLKIDRSFTSRISEQGRHAELLKTIIAIAYSLNQTVVAEGVETEEEAAFLRKHGCHVAQGYLYSKPIPKAAFEQLPIVFGREER